MHYLKYLCTQKEDEFLSCVGSLLSFLQFHFRIIVLKGDLSRRVSSLGLIFYAFGFLSPRRNVRMAQKPRNKSHELYLSGRQAGRQADRPAIEPTNNKEKTVSEQVPI